PDPAGIAAAGATYALALEERQPGRRVAVPRFGPCACRTVAGELLCPALPRRAALGDGAVCDLSLRLGRQDRRADACPRRHLLDGGAGRGDRADRATVWRAARAVPRAWLRCGRVLHLWRRAERPLVLGRHSRALAMGL